MGDVVQQLLATLHQQLQPLGHGIEVAGRIADLVVAPPHGGVEAHCQIPLGEALESLPEAVHGTGQVPGEQGAEEEAAESADPPHGGGMLSQLRRGWGCASCRCRPALS